MRKQLSKRPRAAPVARGTAARTGGCQGAAGSVAVDGLAARSAVGNFGPIGRYPPLAVPRDVARQEPRVLGARVERRHVLEPLAAGPQEVVA
ncbi:MAG TPA: hypothetical protein VJS37_12320, partial [Terriglobales bacterium]|nr:hypothetical protein [Terriglobales bacterium]